MATGSLDANGIWIYGEDDSEATFSALLNKLGDSTSDAVGLVNSKLGKVRQIVTATQPTVFTTTSTSFVSCNLAASITPTASTSKIIAIVSLYGFLTSADKDAVATLYRGTTSGTELSAGKNLGAWFAVSTSAQSYLGFTIVDSPATTSATTYTTAVKSPQAASLQVNRTLSTLTLIEVAA